MSRFTLKLAERIAADSGLRGNGRALLPVLRAAEAAHDNALAQMEERRERPAQNVRRKHDREFVAAARAMWQAWRALDADGRARLAWSAVDGGKRDPATQWLRDAATHAAPNGKSPYGVNYAGVEQRIEQMIAALGTLPMDTPRLPETRGRKKQLGGLEAAHAAFKGGWDNVAGKGWYPTYSLVNEKPPRRPDNAEARVFLAFAQALAVEPRYSLTNCYVASGGKGDGISSK